MVEIRNQEELDKIVKENPDNLVIVKFSASWCGPCKKLAGTINEIAPECTNVTFVDVDIEEADEEFVTKSGIRNVPVLQFFKNGELVDKNVGALPAGSLKNKIEENLGK